tara:strand:+ start:4720 stop:4971 length:252 start_codon:yes stop_codon:yes gene_type:complete
MDLLNHDLLPLGTATLSFVGYVMYMKQSQPEEDNDYQTAFKICAGVALLTYLVQKSVENRDKSYGTTVTDSDVILDGPFAKKE